MSDLTAPWMVGVNRVAALAGEHGSSEKMIEALGLPPGLDEFAAVLSEDGGFGGSSLRASHVAMLVALGAVLARERASS